MKTTLIRNGLIVDGTGAPAFVGDVLIGGDRIEAIFPKKSTPFSLRASASPRETISSPQPLCASASPRETTPPADETIDATGCLVTPGFIDAHTHSDAYLVLEPSAPSKVTQGITTEINGQCGGSVAPRYGEARLSSDWASLLGERLTWRSLAEYRAVLEEAKPAVNTVQFIGHNTLRSSILGYCARPCTDEELRKMTALLEKTLDEGGWGLTTGLIYQPGRYSTPAEVEALAAATAKRGGFYATHMRSEGDRILESIDEVIDLVKKTGIRAEISHLKTGGAKNWHKIDAVLEKMDRAIADGLLLGSDRYPYCAAGTDLDVVLPDWAQEGAAPAELARLRDPATRQRIIDELNASDRDWSQVMIGGTWSEDTRSFSGRTIAQIVDAESSPRRAGRDEISRRGAEAQSTALADCVSRGGAEAQSSFSSSASPRLRVMPSFPQQTSASPRLRVMPSFPQQTSASPRLRVMPSFPQQTSASPRLRVMPSFPQQTSASPRLRVSPFSPGEAVCHILERDLCRTGAFFFSMSEANLDTIYSRPWIVPGSDASLRSPWGPLAADHPHPRAYATMPEFYRRVRALGVSREETIARMTSVPARRFEIRDRGVLRAGAFADVLVWREEDFKARATYLAPHAFSSGMERVFVNGVLTYSNKTFTGHRAGRFLTR